MPIKKYLILKRKTSQNEMHNLQQFLSSSIQEKNIGWLWMLLLFFSGTCICDLNFIVPYRLGIFVV